MGPLDAIAIEAGSDLGVMDVVDLGRSIQGFSFGLSGVVYCASAVIDSSHRFGAQTPKRTRQAATSRFALVGDLVIMAIFRTALHTVHNCLLVAVRA